MKYKTPSGYKYEKYWNDRYKKYDGDMRWCGTNAKSDMENLKEYKKYSKVVVDRIRPNSTVLDVGCGNMYYKEPLRKKNCYYIGIDIVRYYVAISFDITKCWPLDMGIYDYILCLDVLQHISNKDLCHVLYEISNCMDDGTILFLTHQFGSKHKKSFYEYMHRIEHIEKYFIIEFIKTYRDKVLLICIKK